MASWWARWRLKSPASRLFTQPFVQVQIKESIKALRHWCLREEFTGDRWIPCTKGQLRGKCFHLMTSSWIGSTNVSYKYKYIIKNRYVAHNQISWMGDEGDRIVIFPLLWIKLSYSYSYSCSSLLAIPSFRCNNWVALIDIYVRCQFSNATIVLF